MAERKAERGKGRRNTGKKKARKNIWNQRATYRPEHKRIEDRHGKRHGYKDKSKVIAEYLKEKPSQTGFDAGKEIVLRVSLEIQ